MSPALWKHPVLTGRLAVTSTNEQVRVYAFTQWQRGLWLDMEIIRYVFKVSGTSQKHTVSLLKITCSQLGLPM